MKSFGKLISEIRIRYFVYGICLSILFLAPDLLLRVNGLLSDGESELFTEYGKRSKDIWDLLMAYHQKTTIFGLILLILCIGGLIIRKIFTDRKSIMILHMDTLKKSPKEIIDIEFGNVKKIKDIDIIAAMEGLKSLDMPTFQNEIISLIKILDASISEFRKKIIECNYSLIGISHTPFLVRAGTQFSDGKKASLFHLYRDKNEYIRLSDSLTFMELEVIEKELDRDSDELLVTISTTFSIENSKLERFDLDHKNYIKFQTQALGFDVVTSEIQCFKYREMILNEIRRIKDIKHIHKIHLFISSTAEFTFFIGQHLSPQYFPEIISYNYEKQEYAWGISIFKTAEECVIVPLAAKE